LRFDKGATYRAHSDPIGVTISFAAHTDLNVMLSEQAGVIVGCILNAASE
jgi:hypothetical protein